MTTNMPRIPRRARVPDRWESLSSTIGGLTFAAFVMGALYEGLRAWQMGGWQPIDGSGIAHLLIPGTWLDAPQSLLRLHRVVAIFLGLPLFVTGPFVLWAIAGSTLWLLAAFDRRRTDAAQAREIESEDDLREAA